MGWGGGSESFRVVNTGPGGGWGGEGCTWRGLRNPSMSGPTPLFHLTVPELCCVLYNKLGTVRKLFFRVLCKLSNLGRRRWEPPEFTAPQSEVPVAQDVQLASEAGAVLGDGALSLWGLRLTPGT